MGARSTFRQLLDRISDRQVFAEPIIVRLLNAAMVLFLWRRLGILPRVLALFKRPIDSGPTSHRAAIALAAIAEPMLAWFGPGFREGVKSFTHPLLGQVIAPGAGSQLSS